MLGYAVITNNLKVSMIKYNINLFLAHVMHSIWFENCLGP